MNNRQLKFRVWDKAKNKFDTWYNHDKDEPHELKEYFNHSAACFLNALKDTLKDEDFVIQQYTGENDKNRHEIYEGDIVESEKHNFKDEIIFDMGGFCLKKLRLFFGNWFEKELKVIGNIFENSELLK